MIKCKHCGWLLRRSSWGSWLPLQGEAIVCWGSATFKHEPKIDEAGSAYPGPQGVMEEDDG